MFIIFLYGMIILTHFVLQTTLLHLIAIGGILPNTLITLVISIGLLKGSIPGAIFGFLSGLLPDMFFGNFIGFNSVFFLILGYTAGLFNKDFYAENYILPFLLTLFFNFIYGELVYITQFLLRGRVDFIYYLYRKIIPEIVYTTFLSFIVYRILYGIVKLSKGKEKYKYF